ncbi:hypothetical protein GDO81_021800 [Engystomops pustulosus]|uniref:Uncharacterized protein n=1 Tax=Engystomops pustulosus TaxID=76066 RepID=A0AAV6YPN0_ENGPU|nr:hypothetical protein GDO81_021800 [Engystomops pustulosus]
MSQQCGRGPQPFMFRERGRSHSDSRRCRVTAAAMPRSQSVEVYVVYCGA